MKHQGEVLMRRIIRPLARERPQPSLEEAKEPCGRCAGIAFNISPWGAGGLASATFSRMNHFRGGKAVLPLVARVFCPSRIRRNFDHE